MKRLLMIGLILLLAACGTAESATPGPTPEAINLIFPPALQPWADKLGACAASNPLTAIYFLPSNVTKSIVSTNEIVLEIGAPSKESSSRYLARVGWEEIVVIVNQDNELSQLTVSNLRSIYTGQTQAWKDGTGLNIQVWVPPSGDPIREIFDQAVLSGRSLTSEAMLAPDPEAMLEAIADNVNAIGYLPESYFPLADPTLAMKVKTIPLVETVDGLRQPVIAVTQVEPQGFMRELLVCLQTPIP